MSARRTYGRRIAASALLGCAGALVMTSVAGATTGVTASRLQGANRYSTAAAMAEATFPKGSNVAVLASGDTFPDALSAAYLAGRMSAPVLLSAKGSLPAETASALSALKVNQVDIVGGPAAVSAGVEQTLKNDGYMVRRLYGANRDVTAQVVAEAYPSSTVGSLGSDGPTAVVATDRNFPDALTGSPMAYAAAFPILMTPPTTLSAAAKTALGDLGISHVLVLGGTSAISTAVVNAITAMHITVTRVAGANRTQTATDIANLELGQLHWSGAHVNLARGDNFPDALAGGAHAGTEKEPIVLAATPNVLGSATTAWLKAHSSTLTSIHVFGGTAAISNATEAAALAAAR